MKNGRLGLLQISWGLLLFAMVESYSSFMTGYRPSIKQKIITGYLIMLVLIVGFSLFTFIETGNMEKKIFFGEVIAEFFDTTLEMRRFEKNYFLYGNENDREENLKYAARAVSLLDSNREDFKAAVYMKSLSDIREDLNKYRELMALYSQHAGLAVDRDNARSATEIRKLGKHITTIAEGMSKKEKEMIQVMLNNSRRFLLISIVILILIGLGTGFRLSRMVVKPLQQLEDSARLIAEGGFERIVINSKDQEILSLTEAFNTMLAEKELRRKYLIRSEKLASLGTMLSGVAHELNNPLSNISTSCQILIEELDDADRQYKKELLGQIDDQTMRARNIVRCLLDFSRDKEFERDRLPLKGLVEETVQFLKGQVPPGVSIRQYIPEDITIHADKQRMQQCFLNLIKNAVESITGEGNVFITAAGRHSTNALECIVGHKTCLKGKGMCMPGDNGVDIEIKDTGSGIPAQIITKIFDPFFTTKDVGKGSGLGLFVVHEIIEEHGGCIAVASEAQKGTVFRIRMPSLDEGKANSSQDAKV